MLQLTLIVSVGKVKTPQKNNNFAHTFIFKRNP